MQLSDTDNEIDENLTGMACYLAEFFDNYEWILDSSTSDHVTPHIHQLTNL